MYKSDEPKSRKRSHIKISHILGSPQNHKLIRIDTKLNNKNENKTDERENLKTLKVYSSWTEDKSWKHMTGKKTRANPQNFSSLNWDSELFKAYCECFQNSCQINKTSLGVYNI